MLLVLWRPGWKHRLSGPWWASSVVGTLSRVPFDRSICRRWRNRIVQDETGTFAGAGSSDVAGSLSIQSFCDYVPAATFDPLAFGASVGLEVSLFFAVVASLPSPVAIEASAFCPASLFSVFSVLSLLSVPLLDNGRLSLTYQPEPLKTTPTG